MTLDSQGSRERRASLAVLAAFAGISILFTGFFPPNGNPNELSRIQSIYAFVENGTFSIDDAIRRFGDHEDKSVSNGHFYSNKAPGLALAGIPVYRALRVVFPAPRRPWDPIFVLTRLATVTLVSILAAAVFLRRVGDRPEGAMVGAAVLLGTPFLFYAHSFFGHAWTAALLYLAWELLGREDSGGSENLRHAAAGLLAGWAAISEYTTAPLAAILAIRTVRPGPWRRLVFFAAGGALPLALLLLYNRACFGSPWVLSSAREARADYAALAVQGFFGFGPPSPRIAFAYLFDPARGLLWRSPFWIWIVFGFVAWWRSGREQRRQCLFAVVSMAVFFILLTGYGNWHGGWSLGNRYLLPVLFLAGVALPPALESPLSRGLFAAAAVYSVAVNLLMSLTWPHFPDDLSWPAANGSLWFLSRGWIAPSWLPPLPALLLAVAACALALVLSIRVARPGSPRYAVGAVAGLVFLVVSLAAAPAPSFPGKLFRASMYGVFSGLDPSREELKAAVLSASTDSEKRLAAQMWRRFGPRRPASP